MTNKITEIIAIKPHEQGEFILNLDINAYNNPNKAINPAEITLLKTGSFHILHIFSLKLIIKAYVIEHIKKANHLNLTLLSELILLSQAVVNQTSECFLV